MNIKSAVNLINKINSDNEGKFTYKIMLHVLESLFDNVKGYESIVSIEFQESIETYNEYILVEKDSGKTFILSFNTPYGYKIDKYVQNYLNSPIEDITSDEMGQYIELRHLMVEQLENDVINTVADYFTIQLKIIEKLKKLAYLSATRTTKNMNDFYVSDVTFYNSPERTITLYMTNGEKTISYDFPLSFMFESDEVIERLYHNTLKTIEKQNSKNTLEGFSDEELEVLTKLLNKITDCNKLERQT